MNAHKPGDRPEAVGDAFPGTGVAAGDIRLACHPFLPAHHLIDFLHGVMRTMGPRFTTTHRLLGFIALSVLAHGVLLLPWRSAPTPSVTPAAFELTRFELLPALASAPIQEPPRVQHSASPPAPPSVPQAPNPLPDATAHAAVPPVAAKSEPQEMTLASSAEPAVATQSDAERQALAKEQLRAHLIRLMGAHFTYPFLARKHGWEGEVTLSFQVTHTGMIEHIQVSRGSGHGVLDKAAVAALTKIQQVDAGPLPWSWETLELDLPVIFRLTES